MFIDYQLLVSVFNRSTQQNATAVEIAKHALQQCGPTSVDFVRTGTEAICFQDGPPPRFRVFDEILHTLAQCEFRIGIDDFKSPFPAILVQLPEGSGIHCDGYDTEVRNVLCWHKPEERHITYLVQSSMSADRQRPDRPTSIFKLPMKGFNTMEDLFAACASGARWLDPDSPPLTPNETMAHTCALLRVCTGVALLAVSGDKTIERDVLSADFIRYIDAIRDGSSDRVVALQDRCERRTNRKCFTVGRQSHRRLFTQHEAEGTGDGRELTSQHLRRAHFRKLQNGRVVFIHHTIVRPDLPAKTHDITYDLKGCIE